MDHESLAHRMFAQIVDTVGDADADLHVSRVVAELFGLSPIVREHISDLIIADLVEELHRHGEPGRDAARMVGVVQRDWSKEG